MNKSEQQLASLLQQADAKIVGAAAAPLDGGMLVREVTIRARRRTTGRSVAAALLVGVVVTTTVVRQSATDSTIVAVDPVADFTTPAASIEELQVEADALLYSIDSPEQPTFDILTALSNEEQHADEEKYQTISHS